MKKLLLKDKRLRFSVKRVEKQRFVLKSILKNSKLFLLIRWNAFLKLITLINSISSIKFSSRCFYTVSRKKFNKLTVFSRYIFLKAIRFGKLYGIKKSSW